MLLLITEKRIWAAKKWQVNVGYEMRRKWSQWKIDCYDHNHPYDEQCGSGGI